MIKSSFHSLHLISRTLSTLIPEKKAFYKGNYAPDHWALRPSSLQDPKVICLAKCLDNEYVTYINPTDKRGYRCIVALINNKDMAGTLNREYDRTERVGLSILVAMVEEAFQKFVPIVQTFKAGNNSHKLDRDTGLTVIGKAEEPSLLHVHLIGRGDPESEYVAGVKLNGPVPGSNFDMMGKTEGEPGNDKKIRWDHAEMDKVVKTLKFEIEKLKPEYIEFGLTVDI
jgi:hypothetical protein